MNTATVNPARSEAARASWPKKGTPEYDVRVARMRDGMRVRRSKVPGPKQPSPPVEMAVDEIIDVGKPKTVRMQPVPEPESKKSKAKSSATELDEPTVRGYMGLILNYLASRPGHEHWARDEDEIMMISVPGVRCYNRLDKKLREQVQAMSDPLALVFGCVLVLGPSVAQEARDAFRHRSERGGQSAAGHRRSVPSREPEPAKQADAGTGSLDWEHAPAGTGGAAAPTVPVEGLSANGI